jgi:AraC-like DNA-binding protein
MAAADLASHDNGTRMFTDMPQERCGTCGLPGMNETDGQPVNALPRDAVLQVRIEARGVSAERLRSLVTDAMHGSPIPGAVRDGMPIALHIETRGGCENSESRARCLAALSDRIVGAALKALHDRPARAWTLEELARAAGTSRSVLAERFHQMVGSSPIQYLTQWRMTLAAHLLMCRGKLPLAQVAEQVGYQTDTAFSRAFRREFGAPPSAWRRSQARRGANADTVS